MMKLDMHHTNSLGVPPKEKGGETHSRDPNAIHTMPKSLSSPSKSFLSTPQNIHSSIRALLGSRNPQTPFLELYNLTYSLPPFSLLSYQHQASTNTPVGLTTKNGQIKQKIKNRPSIGTFNLHPPHKVVLPATSILQPSMSTKVRRTTGRKADSKYKTTKQIKIAGMAHHPPQTVFPAHDLDTYASTNTQVGRATKKEQFKQ